MVVALPASKATGRAQDKGPCSSTTDNCIPDRHYISSTLPFRTSVRNPNTDRYTPTQSLSNPKQAQAWFSGYFDRSGKFNVASSSVLKSHLDELFSPHFQQKVATIVAKEDSSIYIDPAVYESKKTDFRNLRSQSPELDNQARKHAPVAKNKRVVSDEFMSAKRRKSCPEDTEQLLRLSSTVDDNAIKTEQAYIATDEDDDSDDDEFAGTGYSSVAVRVDDVTQLEGIVDTRLRQMQQTGCKLVAKAWIKVHEPQKQTKYPYNGGVLKEEATRWYGDKNLGELTKPPWWPSTEGWPNNGGCRHREPDHLKKPERLVLLKHMLKICPVAMLKDSTKEVQTGPSGMKPFAIDHLREIYRLRDKQERYERGEIGERCGIFQTSPIRADGHVSPPPDGGTIIPVELLPTENHDGPKPVRGRQELITVATTNKTSPITQNSSKVSSKAAATPDFEGSQQEVAIGDEIVVHLSDQQSIDICQPSGENMQAPAFEDTEKNIYRPTSNIQNEYLYDASAYHTPTLLDLQASRHNARHDYHNVESALRFRDSYHDASFGDGSELPRNHGLPHDSTWGGFDGTLAPARHSGSSTLEMPFFNNAYNFDRALMNNPSRGSIPGVFPNPLNAGGHGPSWNFSFAHSQQR